MAGYCRPCASPTAVLVLCLCGLLAVCAGLLVLNLKETGIYTATSAVIGVNALQIIAQFGRLDVAWPKAAQRVFGESA